MRKWILTGILAAGVCSMAVGSEEGMHFSAGLSYVDGFRDLGDTIEDRLDDAGYSIDQGFVPIGLELRTHYMFEHGSMIGFDVGPIGLVIVDVVGGPNDGTYTHTDIPVGVSYGYMLLPKARVSPFARAGLKAHIGVGDFRTGTEMGAVVGGGLSILNDKAVQVQFEVAYDTTEGTYDIFGAKEDIEVHGLTVTIRAVF